MAEEHDWHPARQGEQVLVPSAATTSNCPSGHEPMQVLGSATVPAPELSTNPFSQVRQLVALEQVAHDAVQAVLSVPSAFRKNLSFAVLQADAVEHSLHSVPEEVSPQVAQTLLVGLRKKPALHSLQAVELSQVLHLFRFPEAHSVQVSAAVGVAAAAKKDPSLHLVHLLAWLHSAQFGTPSVASSQLLQTPFSRKFPVLQVWQVVSVAHV